MKLTAVHLHGILGEEFGDRHEYHLTIPRDLVRALQANHPNFRRRILELEQEGFGYRLISGDCFDGSADMGVDDLFLLNRGDEIHLVPVIVGSGAVGKILGGAVLIGAGFLLGGPGGGLLAKGLIGVGASLALGGVNQILAPKPPSVQQQQGSANLPSNTIFGAGGGVSDFNYAIPLIYGLSKIQSPAILSSSTKAIRVGGTDLQNDTYFSVIAAISEGEIVGLANTSNPANSIFLGETPLVGSIGNPASGEQNFGTVTVLNNTGTAGQAPLNLMSNALLEETDVGVELEDGVGVIRTITGDYYGFWIKTTISVLYYNTSTEIVASPLNFYVDVQTDGGGYVRISEFQVNGKTTQAFQQTFEFGLPASVSKSWNIRVTTIRPLGEFTLRPDRTERRADAAWATLTTLQAKTTNYPNTALLGLEIDAKFLGSSPNLSVVAKGIKVSVPHNYDPVSRAYFGGFNGTLSGTKQWTNNPVWILYDLLTNSRYGVGLASSQIDLYSFYSASVYCDAFVSNGAGGVEPRFTFNSGIFQRSDGQDLLRQVAGSFNSFIVWSDSKIALAQDRPVTPVWAFTQANVVVDVDNEGKESPHFEYSQVDFGNRYSSANIAFIDGTTWEPDVETVKDASLEVSLGYKPAEVTAVGCTSRGQAARIGRWEIFNSAYCDQLITFRAARDLLPIEVGDVVEVFDRYEQGQKLGGRIFAVNSSVEFQLDQSPTTGIDYDLTILFPDGTQQTRDVVSVVDDVVTVAIAFSPIPSVGHLYALRRTDVNPTLWRIISISEDDEETFQVQGVKYLDTKWTYIESGVLLSPKTTTLLRTTPNPPTNLSIETYAFLNPSGTAIKLMATWQWKPPTTGVEVVRYEIEYKKTGVQNPITAIAFGGSYEAELEQGEYTFKIRSVSALGFVSAWAAITSNIDFTNDIPSNVENFSVNPRSREFAQLTWLASPDIDVRLAGKIRIRYSATAIGWDNALLLQEFPGISSTGQVPLLDGTYYAKWVDPYGNESAIAASSTADNLGLLNRNIVATISEDPLFAGAKTNCYVNANGFLTIEPVLKFDSGDGLFDDNPLLWDDYTGGVYEEGAIYEFFNELDVTDVQDVAITADYAAISSSSLTYWDDATGLFDSRPDAFDGFLTGNAQIRLQLRTTTDGVIYSPWRDFTVGTFRLINAQFRAILAAFGGENIEVSDLNVIADVVDREEIGTVTTSAGADTVVTFSRPYITPPPNGVAYSIQSGSIEDEVEIFDITKDGFKINIRALGSRISRSVRWATESY